jgi:hypothetical protein
MNLKGNILLGIIAIFRGVRIDVTPQKMETNPQKLERGFQNYSLPIKWKHAPKKLAFSIPPPIKSKDT